MSGEMIDGVMLLWFVLTAMSLLFVAVDIRATPESPILKWGFLLLTAYTGPFGAFLYILSCREPLPGLHERYVAVRWRQVVGSTMHCVAGDGVGILAGAVIASIIHMSSLTEISLEYLLGFGFGWAIFQALFMRDEAGGSYNARIVQYLLPGITVHELPYGRHGADNDISNEPCSREPRSLWGGILVRYVHGPSRWLRHCVPHELVAGI